MVCNQNWEKDEESCTNEFMIKSLKTKRKEEREKKKVFEYTGTSKRKKERIEINPKINHGLGEEQKMPRC